MLRGSPRGKEYEESIYGKVRFVLSEGRGWQLLELEGGKAVLVQTRLFRRRLGVGGILAGWARSSEGKEATVLSRGGALLLEEQKEEPPLPPEGVRALPPSLKRKLLWQYGAHWEAFLALKPYAPSEDGLVPFDLLDERYRALGLEPEEGVRLRAGVLDAFRRLREDGHTAAGIEELFQALPLDPTEGAKAIEATLGEGLLTIEGTLLLLQEDRLREGELASWALARVPPLGRLPAPQGAFPLTPSQKEALDTLRRALEGESRGAILTGGPGTGKTTLLRLLLGMLEGAGLAPEEVLFLAPTGKGALRLGESVGRRAHTIGKALRLGGRLESGVDFGRTRVCVVDEAGMVDTPTLYALVGSLSPRAKVLLVGDIDQLPPVGEGAPMRDLMAVWPVATLRETVRQRGEGRVVASALGVLAGKPPREDLSPLPEALSPLLPFLEEGQVLTPYRVGPWGTEALNEGLLRLRFPGEGAFTPGKKLIATRNDYAWGVRNGQVLLLRWEEGGGFLLEDGETGERVFLPKEVALGSLEPAYAITVHKSQGSEWERVALVLGPPPKRGRRVLNRSLLYTGITRARASFHLFADEKTLEEALATPAPERRTYLQRGLRNPGARRDK